MNLQFNSHRNLEGIIIEFLEEIYNDVVGETFWKITGDISEGILEEIFDEILVYLWKKIRKKYLEEFLNHRGNF